MCSDAEWPVPDLAPALEHVVKCTDDHFSRSKLDDRLLLRRVNGKHRADEDDDLCMLLDIDVATEELTGACSHATLLETLETSVNCIIDDFWSHEQFAD
jgi:hypothetical protein